MEGVVGQADKNDSCLVHLQRRRLLGREQLAPTRQLDSATRLRLQLAYRVVRGPADMVAMVGMTDMTIMVSLRLAAAVRNDHASHRMADMENHAGGTRGCERKREK
jgi:hypothetical protein